MADADCTELDQMDVALFWSKVSITTRKACWIWIGTRTKFGHGQFKKFGRSHAAHRVAYSLFHGQIPDDTLVRHKCDNPSCCNPKHLETGTHQDNVADRVLRRRSAIGERVGTAKLTEQDVIAIEADGTPSPALAERYGVSVDTIRSIKQRRTWKHLWCRDRESNSGLRVTNPLFCP